MQDLSLWLGMVRSRQIAHAHPTSITCCLQPASRTNLAKAAQIFWPKKNGRLEALPCLECCCWWCTLLAALSATFFGASMALRCTVFKAARQTPSPQQSVAADIVGQACFVCHGGTLSQRPWRQASCPAYARQSSLAIAGQPRQPQPDLRLHGQHDPAGGAQ